MPLATERFSTRAKNYLRYRPHYPPAVVECLRVNCQLSAAATIADIGSGTGLLAELFLQNGNAVFGVEPNREMREAGEHWLRQYSRFVSITGTAEATTLPVQSMDFIVAGQAFHWFDRQKTGAEFRRILNPQGWVALVWNKRREESTPFGRAYEALLRAYATDYEKVNHKQINEAVLAEFFGPGFGLCTAENHQRFDFAGLKGRLLSSSYTPEEGAACYPGMLAELQRIFASYQHEGAVTFEYDTNIYFGRLN
jgi:SAM-dependent methyltransferase